MFPPIWSHAHWWVIAIFYCSILFCLVRFISHSPSHFWLRGQTSSKIRTITFVDRSLFLNFWFFISLLWFHISTDSQAIYAHLVSFHMISQLQVTEVKVNDKSLLNPLRKTSVIWSLIHILFAAGCSQIVSSNFSLVIPVISIGPESMPQHFAQIIPVSPQSAWSLD